MTLNDTSMAACMQTGEPKTVTEVLLYIVCAMLLLIIKLFAVSSYAKMKKARDSRNGSNADIRV